jgi:hypothetical protein
VQALPLAVMAMGVVAAFLLVATEFSPVATVDVASGSCEVIQDTDPELADRCELSGFERNGGAFLLLALLIVAMAWGAGFGRSRPAAFALVVVGALVLLWAALVDLPVTDETGALGRNFEGAGGAAGPGLTLEIVGGALALAAGVVALLVPQRRSTAALTVFLPFLVLPAAATAQVIPVAPVVPAHVDVGIADQSADLFTDPRFKATGIRYARLIVPYDVVRVGGRQLWYADLWLAAARRYGIEPLVTFSHASKRRRQFRLPKVREYSARVREFRERYPWVREYATWNEANLVSVQPTARHPRRAAAFYRALRRQCAAAGCRVLAVEVLLTGSWKTWRWIRRFRAAAGRGPHTWGVHNYPDVTRLSRRNTGIFMRRVPRDEIWFTETGGVVKFRKRWPYDERRAARAVRHTFRLAAASPRIKRIYLYNWRADARNRRWDSGIIAADGSERRAYHELLDGLALDRFRPPPPPVVPDTPPSGPVPADDSDD